MMHRQATKDKIKVLLAEDTPVNQLLTVSLLKKWKFDVDVAENGKEAIEKLKRNRYDIVLMDIQMPEMDGYETAKYIRTKMPGPVNRIPIVALTASIFPDERKKLIKFGMNDYISKPFDPNDLYDKILKLVQGKKEPANFPDHRDGDEKYVNLSYLRKVSLNDDELMREIINLLLKETPIYIDKMKKLCDEENWDELKRVAHQVKSKVSYMGIERLRSVIEQIERKAMERADLEKLPDMISEIESICNKAYNELREELKKR